MKMLRLKMGDRRGVAHSFNCTLRLLDMRLLTHLLSLI